MPISSSQWDTLSGLVFSKLRTKPSTPNIHKPDLFRNIAPANSPFLPTRSSQGSQSISFYVNAATSHSISLKTIKDWKEKCGSSSRPVGCDKDPLYLAVSSRADLLTAIVMPIANIVLFSPHTDQYHLISAANTPWLQNTRSLSR